ncbi:MAG: diguanylate cyclase [Humidesulfovibrio sp.]|uniref:GGDEF domain-containing protein n=1 Tax=Humidesulfovibrio sp. TaxID=2910988 RepID=UPI0027365F5B|nr:diguanylate cyclase [Humidesulfovibrio sp.]MDP2847210.1 diguanylate cyclase [Humidesulfovibrio sp.]
MDPRDHLPPLRLKGLGVLGLLRLYSALLLLLPILPLLLYWLATSLNALPISLEWLLIVSMALALVFSAFLGHAIARTILDPLKLLVQGAQKIQDGEYGHIIDPAATLDAPTEFKQLVRAFNRMSATVLDHIETIQTTSRTDQLTGMSNRRHLMAEGYRILSVALRGGKPCSSLMIDIDHFKNVNDTHGHPVGDKFLIHIAGCIASAIRESDMAARYGGEEFVVLAPNASLTEARTLAERIRETVTSTPLKLGDIVLNNTVSIGVAEYAAEPQFGASILEDMIEKADKALYRAKQCGRNRVESWPFPDGPPDCP